MLVSAYAYQDELLKSYQKTLLDPYFMFYYESWSSTTIEIPPDTYGSLMFVSIYKEKVIGYLKASVDRSINNVTSIGVMNFTKEINITFSRDLYKFLNALFTTFNFNKISFHVTVGNPAEKMYDRIIKKYNGNICGFEKRHVKLQDGNIYDIKRYEIFKEDYMEANKNVK